jgi:hypothetical protein
MIHHEQHLLGLLAVCKCLDYRLAGYTDITMHDHDFLGYACIRDVKIDDRFELAVNFLNLTESFPDHHLQLL